MNTSCSTQFNYFDSWQFQATVSHILAIVTLPFNLFGGYCIVYKTPRHRGSAKWYLLHLHSWTVISDILIAGLLTPYMFFPVLVGIPAGLLSWIGIDIGFQVFLAQLGLGGLATSIVMIFENRHNNLVRGRFKIEMEWIRYTYYCVNGIYSILFLLPCYFRIPDPIPAKLLLLKILPCPHPDYFLDTVFVFSMDISSVTGTAGIYLIFMCVQVIGLCAHSLFYLSNLNKLMSQSTKKLQRKFFVDMIFQVSIPIGIIVLPMSYCFYSVIQQYYNQMYNNIAIICISLHGISSTITLISLNPSYRKFIKQLILMDTKGSKRNSIGQSMAHQNTITIIS